MTILISIALATICFTSNGVNECFPAILGKNNTTPVGQYTLTRRITQSPGYGGDVLQFYETRDEVYAIHRVWLLNSKQNRASRLKSSVIADRYISAGCVNVDPAVYDKLVDCCSNDTLIIKQ